MPYIMMLRTDIPDGSLQILDLQPNTSLRNQIYEGPGQTGYVRNIPNPSLEGGMIGISPIFATRDLTGLAAYIVGNVDQSGAPNGTVLSATEADDMAAGLVAIAQAGTVLDIAAVNAALAAVAGGTTLTAGGSTGVLTELLSVMSGSVYLILAGSQVGNDSGDFEDRAGAFTTLPAGSTIDTGAYQLSLSKGNLAGMRGANFTYLETQGAAVVVYADDGTLVP